MVALLLFLPYIIAIFIIVLIITLFTIIESLNLNNLTLRIAKFHINNKQCSINNISINNEMKITRTMITNTIL